MDDSRFRQSFVESVYEQDDDGEFHRNDLQSGVIGILIAKFAIIGIIFGGAILLFKNVFTSIGDFLQEEIVKGTVERGDQGTF